MEHPIQGLMDTAMKNIKAMVDVDTIIGDPVTTPDGSVIIPISTVSFGFGAGGSEFSPKSNAVPGGDSLFGGGCGGGANVKPIAFLVMSGGSVRLLPVSDSASPMDRLVDLVPEVLQKMNCAVSGIAKKMSGKEKKQDENTTSEDAPEVDVAE